MINENFEILTNTRSNDKNPCTFENNFNAMFAHQANPRKIDILVEHLLSHQVNLQFILKQNHLICSTILEEACFSILFLKENIKLSEYEKKV